MTLLVRKINKAKWYIESLEERDSIKADAVTNCIRTTSNTLSFWAVESEDDVDEAVLAIAASNDNLDTFDVIVVNADELSSRGFSIQKTPGKTRCADLVDSHRDLVDLTLANLSVLSHEIAEIVFRSDERRYKLGDLKALIRGAIRAGRLDLSALPENIQRKVQ